MEYILWIILVGVQLALLGAAFVQHRKENGAGKLRLYRNYCYIGQLVLFAVLICTGIVGWNFRWLLLGIYLLIRGIVSGVWLVRHGRDWCRSYENIEIRIGRRIAGTAAGCILITVLLVPAFVFPERNQLPTTGKYLFGTVSETWTDESRVETFETDGSKRNVTVQFWYPENAGNEKLPLVVFSHGAFGYRMSNYSTYAELASNGYVVCSVEHPYHAIFSEEADGSIITVNPQFMHDVLYINSENVSEDEIFRASREWMKLRCADLNFVLDTIQEKAAQVQTTRTQAEQTQAEQTQTEQTQTVQDNLFWSNIDVEHIGLMGHSLGGAASVTLARSRSDIDAVIDIDETMLGEETDCRNNEYTMNAEPYPVPLLCIDSTEHYEAGKLYGDQYVNAYILQNAKNGREIHFDGTGHMNFTDLPRFSPLLAGLLGTGTIDTDHCIQTMNGVILEYYNHYLKGNAQLQLQEVYE